MNRGMTRHLHGMQVTFTQLMRDADGSSRTDTEREHEGKIRHLVGDMMRRESLLADPTDDDERGGEEEGLRKRLQTDRCSDGHQMFHLTAGDESSANGYYIASPVGPIEHRHEKTKRHHRTGDECSPTGSFRTHSSKAAVTEDKNPVKDYIEYIAP